MRYFSALSAVLGGVVVLISGHCAVAQGVDGAVMWPPRASYGTLLEKNAGGIRMLDGMGYTDYGFPVKGGLFKPLIDAISEVPAPQEILVVRPQGGDVLDVQVFTWPCVPAEPALTIAVDKMTNAEGKFEQIEAALLAKLEGLERRSIVDLRMLHNAMPNVPERFQVSCNSFDRKPPDFPEDGRFLWPTVEEYSLWSTPIVPGTVKVTWNERSSNKVVVHFCTIYRIPNLRLAHLTHVKVIVKPSEDGGCIATLANRAKGKIMGPLLITKLEGEIYVHIKYRYGEMMPVRSEQSEPQSESQSEPQSESRSSSEHTSSEPQSEPQSESRSSSKYTSKLLSKSRLSSTSSRRHSRFFET